MSARSWLVVVLVVIVCLGWYLSYSAARLDRLHHRVEGARAMLDAQLVRRAEAAVELATSGMLDPASGLLVAAAAADALSSGEEDDDPGQVTGDDEMVADRETAESDLTRALQVALADDDFVAGQRDSGSGAELLDRVASTCHRAQLARRFHNQAVMDAQRVRRKRVVRWAHLAGRAPLPQTVEIDDDPPVTLTR